MSEREPVWKRCERLGLESRQLPFMRDGTVREEDWGEIRERNRGPVLFVGPLEQAHRWLDARATTEDPKP